MTIKDHYGNKQRTTHDDNKTMNTNNNSNNKTMEQSSKPPEQQQGEEELNTTNTTTTLTNDSDLYDNENNTSYTQKSAELIERNRKLGQDLADFVERVVKGMHPTSSSKKGDGNNDNNNGSVEKEAELQLQTARMMRQILPGNRELLPIVEEKGWTQLLLSWLNLHDRPAVQIEALLALTTIADLTQQSQTFENVSNSIGSLPGGIGSMGGLSSIIGNTGSIGGGVGDLLGTSNPNNDNNVNNNNNGNNNNIASTAETAVATGVNDTIGRSMKQAQQQKHRSGIEEDKGNTENKYNLLPYSHYKKVASEMPFLTAEKLMRAEKVIQKVVNSDNVNVDINSDNGGLQLNGSARLATSSTPMPQQPSSFNNTDNLPYPTAFMGNFSHSMFQNLLMNNEEALPTLLSLLSSPNSEVHEHAMWILGNIAAAPPNSSPMPLNVLNDPNGKSSIMSAKEILLDAGVMTPLLECLEKNHENIALQRIGSWAISNFVEQQGKAGKIVFGGDSKGDKLDFDISVLLQTLKRLLDSTDDDILNYTCWALSHLCDSTASLISAVVTTSNPCDPPGGLVPRLVKLLHHENWKVTKPALRAIGNIVCAEYDEDCVDKSSTPTDFTEVILECDAVPRLKLLITHNNREIQKEACWTLSNIAAGTIDQIQAVIDSGAIPLLVQLVNDKKTDQEVRSEASWVVLNATSCGSDEQISLLVSEGCVSVLGMLLEETTMVSMALEGFERVLQVEKNYELARSLNGGGDNTRPQSPLVSPDLVESAMKKTNSTKVHKKVQQIWNDHFVSCALCNKPYSKHRLSDAKFCEECKCHVCLNCNCEIYHLSYQEELWAASEEKVTASKQAKKSKKQKKREKRKEKNKTKVQEGKPSSDSEKTKGKKDQASDDDVDDDNRMHTGIDAGDNTMNQNSVDADKSQPPIDFSLYLQQTGSIIALARLMDDFYEGNTYKCVNIPNQ